MSDDEAWGTRKEIWRTIGGSLSSVRSGDSPDRSADTTTSTAPFWFLGGDEPTKVDATLFGSIVPILLCTA